MVYGKLCKPPWYSDSLGNMGHYRIPDGIEISPIFNVVDLYPYRAGEVGEEDEQTEVQWTKQIPVAEKPQMENIIDKRVIRKTRRKEYFEYLVKWKGHLVADASWEKEMEI